MNGRLFTFLHIEVHNMNLAMLLTGIEEQPSIDRMCGTPSTDEECLLVLLNNYLSG